MRQTCLNCAYEHALADERVVFIGSDLGVNTLDKFRREMPDRFFMEGVSEANVVGMAAGLAAEGHIVYVNTLAVFLTRRAYEQVALDVCLHNLDVRLLGNGGGLVYAPLGPTHTATDDIALMRTLPNMTILAPSDAREMRRVMGLLRGHRGPAYVRMAKGGDPLVSEEDTPAAIGKAVPARDGKDALITTTGVTLGAALAAADTLSTLGVNAAVLHFPTVKPLDTAALREAIAAVPVVVSIEEHIATGGLGSAVAEVLAETADGIPRRFARLAIPNVYPDHYGSQAALMRHYGIDAETLVRCVQTLREGTPWAGC